MTIPDRSPHSVPPSTTRLRLTALGRRVSASGSLAIVLADLAYGPLKRDDVTTLHVTSSSRVAGALEAHS